MRSCSTSKRMSTRAHWCPPSSPLVAGPAESRDPGLPLRVSHGRPWRIRKSSQKRRRCRRCCEFSRRHRATVHVDDSPAHTRRPPAGHHCPRCRQLTETAHAAPFFRKFTNSRWTGHQLLFSEPKSGGARLTEVPRVRGSEAGGVSFTPAAWSACRRCTPRRCR